jgi:L-fuconolactonase
MHLRSDWPVCLLAATYAEVVEALRSAVRDLDPARVEAIFGANAVRTYGLVV